MRLSPRLSQGTKSLCHQPRPKAEPGPCCRGPRRPAQQSSRPSVLVFWKMVCMADTRSSSWMWKTWNCGQTGQGRHGDVGPVAVRGVCSLTTGPSCPRAPRGAPPGRWTRPGLSPGLPHVQVSLEGPATRRPREALWALSVLAPPATPPGCALGGGAGLGSLETWGWRGGDWKGCWKLGAQEGSRQSSRHPPTLKGGGEGLLGPGCSRNRPMRPGRPQLFMRDGTRGGSGDREVPDILPWFLHSSPGPVGHRWAGHSGPA